MEVSSHALDQHRVDGVEFTAGVFTNLSRDHLDYHGTAEAYFQAKSRLISHLRADGVAVVNADDEIWRSLPSAPRVVSYAVDVPATIRAVNVQCSTHGSVWDIVANDEGERATIQLPLMGDFNVSNALAAAAAVWAGGMPLASVAARLATLPQIPGRLERIAEAPTVLRDYAHKPDALERVLAALRPFVLGRLILVFGCGGDRDRGKRPIMGRIAETGADVVILTSDNPRTEDPDAILDEIEMGMPSRRHIRLAEREAAIAKALALAEAGDVVLLAGKGHETYQIRGTTSYPFDERAIVRKLLGASGAWGRGPHV
jgi:UDP-N-acetylmuramoyl-L-alanyl-D-glutamate--2,6-diaminopimelate ligase